MEVENNEVRLDYKNGKIKCFNRNFIGEISCLKGGQLRRELIAVYILVLAFIFSSFSLCPPMAEASSEWKLNLEVEGKSKEDNLFVGMGDPENFINPPTPPEPYVDWYISSGDSKYYGSIVSIQEEYSWDIELAVSPGQEVAFSWQDLESRVPDEYSIHLVVNGEDINLRNRDTYGPLYLEEGIYDLQIIASKNVSDVVVTEPASGVGKNYATLNMSYDFGNYDTGDLRFEWRKTGGSWNSTDWTSKSGSGSYSEELSGLSPGTDYEFRAQGKYGDGKVDDGTILQFTTSTETNNPPKAAFSHSPTNPEPGEPVNFDASNSSDDDGEIVSSEWSFGDDSSASGMTVSHTYSSVGNYSVQLTVTDDDSATDSISKTVSVSEETVNEKPSANAGGPYSVDENDSVVLDGGDSTDPDGSIENYNWRIVSGSGNLQNSGSTNPTYAAPENISSETMVEVKLIVTDDKSATDTDNAIITVNDVTSKNGISVIKIILPILILVVIGIGLYFARKSKLE